MKTVTISPQNKSFRVGKLLCIGRNYPEHAKEMKAEVPGTPIVFLKPATSLIGTGEDVVIPPFSHALHHEVELVVLITRQGKNIPRSQAMEYVGGYGVGLDMTLRDVQSEAKQKGLPWSVSKGFDTSAPVSPFVARDAVADPHQLDISLTVNGVVRQSSNTRNMIFSIDRLIEYMSSVFTLEEGDLIFTGTPEGVGQVRPGDTMVATITGVGTLTAGVR